LRELDREENLEKSGSIIDNIEEDCSKMWLSLMEADRLARDRNRWDLLYRSRAASARRL